MRLDLLCRTNAVCTFQLLNYKPKSSGQEFFYANNKRLFYVLPGLVALILLIGLFLPSSFHVERSIVINMPVDSVFKQVNDFNNYAQWNPWLALDPEARTQVSEPSFGAGSQWSWEGEIIGKGQLTRLEVETNKSIRSKLIFDDNEDNPSYHYWKFETAAEGTTVTWGM